MKSPAVFYIMEHRRPAYNHTRDDSALTPCPVCVPGFSKVGEFALADEDDQGLWDKLQEIIPQMVGGRILLGVTAPALSMLMRASVQRLARGQADQG